MNSNSRGRVWRARWAAVGAAVAVTLGAGGLSLAGAAGDDAAALVPVDPVRILDTRRDLGLIGPFEASTPRDVKVTGSVPVSTGGSAVVVPPEATAVSVNITVVQPDAKGFLALRPGGATGTPETSTVNFEAGINTPNAATVTLSADGKVQVWVEMPSTTAEADVLLDIVGYYVDTDSRYYTEGEVDSKLGTKADKTALDGKADKTALDAKADKTAVDAKANSSDVYTKAQVDTAHNAINSQIDADYNELKSDVANSSGVDYAPGAGGAIPSLNTPVEMVTMTVNAPVAGHLVVTGTAEFNISGAGVFSYCAIYIDGGAAVSGGVQDPGTTFVKSGYSNTVGTPVSAGVHTVGLRCEQQGGSVGDVNIFAPWLTAVFSPNRL